MFPCPHCDFQVQDGITACPSCDEDLTALAVLGELPDHLYNKALQALKNGDASTAISACGAALNMKFRDPGLWMLFGLAAARQGAFDLAEQCWKTVLMLSRNYEPARNGLKLIKQIRQQPQQE